MTTDTYPWLVPVAALLMGMIAGSFLATLAIRWPAGRSIARGRSACDACNVPIPGWRLVPLVSFVAQRGRCGACGGVIDWRHPAMELACGLIGLFAMLWRPDAVGVAGALFGWLLAALALIDFDHFWLPDRLTFPLAALGLLAGPAPLADRLTGAVAGYAALALIAAAYRRARGRVGLGQGDAKLLGAIGAWLGWQMLPWVVLGACAIGIVWALAARKQALDRLPLGTLLAVAGWGGWLWVVTHVF
ncbi:A24 family peptidase [Sphingomonas sp. BIUV-7]|uniref:Prepilin leader peptidase/N-methyltransferase n=1 Tax=Sphingomonas natans TaxID=3063330 RepID=A0ABT8YC20_9SPHN|nr:A24 family peptidase [Sphingomonas sp. BIUV-7]MDO6415527.1 A24 family peptidase [Sphingomonas sp. BIUV-7]